MVGIARTPLHPPMFETPPDTPTSVSEEPVVQQVQCDVHRSWSTDSTLGKYAKWTFVYTRTTFTYDRVTDLLLLTHCHHLLPVCLTHCFSPAYPIVCRLQLPLSCCVRFSQIFQDCFQPGDFWSSLSLFISASGTLGYPVPVLLGVKPRVWPTSFFCSTFVGLLPDTLSHLRWYVDLGCRASS